MDSSPLSTLAKQHFSYLIDSYGFRVTREVSTSDTFGNAQVLFESTKVGIDIVLDRGQVLIRLGLISQPDPDWFEFATIVRQFTPEIQQVYLFEDKPIYTKIDVEEQIQSLAQLMLQYCVPALLGDFP